MDKVYCQGTVLCDSPLIVYSSQFQAKAAAVNVLPRVIGNREAIFLLLTAYTLELRDSIDAAVQFVRERRETYPNHRIVFMTNTDRETELLHEAGLEAAHFNSNAFVSQEFFHPIDGMEIRYEAVHNGQILRVKRHELAARIANLALIYYNHEGEGLEYFRSLRSLLRGAHFLNETISGKVDGFLSTYQINQIYAQSGCGLCLSAQEGAMYASIEYLLAGLPVVSTRSIGGREEFLDSYNCVFAEGNPESVRDTAAEIIRRKLDRHRIRRDAVERQDKVIAGFRAYVSSLISDYGELRDVSAYWKEIYVSKLLNWLPVDEFLGSFPKRGG